MTFPQWLDQFIEEKELDPEYRFEVQGPEWGWNSIPLGCVVEAMKASGPQTQEQLQRRLIGLDFVNADMMKAFEIMARSLAL